MDANLIFFFLIISFVICKDIQGAYNEETV